LFGVVGALAGSGQISATIFFLVAAAVGFEQSASQRHGQQFLLTRTIRRAGPEGSSSRLVELLQKAAEVSLGRFFSDAAASEIKFVARPAT